MKIEQRVGLTPMIKRLAAKYLMLGVGTYECNSLGYDEVVVSRLRRWKNWASPGEPDSYSLAMQVAFYRAGKRERWVDFGTFCVGGGGPPMVSVIEGGKEPDQEEEE
jgi:hypothetical protein